jgi:DNA invertase Pin-like site-specific DNA recombinase
MKYVAYYRVSTKRQGESQLGLKAQKHAVERFISPEMIDKEFTEVETGTSKRYRPILNEAIELCKNTGATLIIAKLDRLARNVSFVSSLMDSKVKFKAVDMPQANELTIHIMSAIAQHEAKAISKRVKEGLAQSTKKLGTPANLTEEARLRGLESIRHKAKNNPNNKRALAYIKMMKERNELMKRKKLKLKEYAEELNSEGFKTSTGKDFGTTQVIRLLKKIA